MTCLVFLFLKGYLFVMKFVASREHTYRYMYILTRVYTYCVPFSINASKVRHTDAAKQNIVDGITFVRSSRIVFAVSRTVSRALKKKKEKKKQEFTSGISRIIFIAIRIESRGKLLFYFLFSLNGFSVVLRFLSLFISSSFPFIFFYISTS